MFSLLLIDIISYLIFINLEKKEEGTETDYDKLNWILLKRMCVYI